MYLSVSDETISAALIQENPKQRPVYFISRVLQSAETRYQLIEKIALTLLTAARGLRQYFQSHQVIVRTDHPIAKILRKPDLAGRMIAWSVELSEFGLKYEPRGSVKGQHLADFAAELHGLIHPSEQTWVLFIDGSSDRRNAGVGIVIEGPGSFTVEHSLQFKFKASNNQAEYVALIVGLRLAKDLANITARQVHSFVWRNIVCCFGLPHTIITDNGCQFIDKKLKDFYKQVGIRYITSSVEHPQTNSQAEAMNKVIVAELKKRLGEAKGAWVDELSQVLWAYRCTPHGTRQENHPST